MKIVATFTTIVLISYLLISTQLMAGATYPTFHLDAKKYPLSPAKYRHYAKPQLNNMRKEFYHIIQKFSFFGDQIVKSRNNFLTNIYLFHNFTDSCYQDNECLSKLEKAYKSLKLMNNNLLKLKYQIATKLNTFEVSDIHTTNFTQLMSNTLLLENLLLNVIHSIHIDTEESYKTTTKHEKQIRKIIFSMYHQLNYLIIDTLPQDLQKDFETVWFYFFRPLEKYILPAKDGAVLLQRTEELNMAWNSFHMKISKGEVRIPTNGHKIIITMHRRWVSILKLFLKK